MDDENLTCPYCGEEFNEGEEVFWIQKGTATFSSRSGCVIFEGVGDRFGIHPLCLMMYMYEDGYDPELG